MINAIAKRRLAFRKADGSFITVVPGELVSLPDECAKDPMYTWAVKDGALVVSDQVIVKAPELPKKEATVETEAPPPETEEAPVEEKPAKKAPAKKAAKK